MMKRVCGFAVSHNLRIITPHRSSSYVPAAYCYRPSSVSVVCRSVSPH